MQQVMLVCTGNTCRSPMAEALLRDLAERRGINLTVRSAGVTTVDGMPVSANARRVLENRKLDVPGPSSTLTAEGVAWADLILTLTTGHKREIIHRYPDAISKIFTLKEFAMRDDRTMHIVVEAERLYSEWQIRQSLGQSLSAEEQARLFELQRALPDFDIGDPFGGPFDLYEQCADEIEDALMGVIERLNEQPGAGAED